jgi:hypothetical protein
MDATYCMGVMDGMAGANELERERGPGHAVYCLPAPMKPWLEAKVIVDYAKARPDLLALPEVHYAMLAMAASYPCALFIGIAPQENPGQSALSPGERCRNEGQVQLSGVKGKGAGSSSFCSIHQAE